MGRKENKEAGTRSGQKELRTRIEKNAVVAGLLAQLTPWKLVRSLGVGAIAIGVTSWIIKKTTSSHAEK